MYICNELLLLIIFSTLDMRCISESSSVFRGACGHGPPLRTSGKKFDETRC